MKFLIFSFWQYDGQSLKNYFKIFSLLFSHHVNYFIRFVFRKMKFCKTQIFGFIRRKSLTVNKNAVMQTTFTSRKNNRAITFFKNPFFQSVQNHFFTLIKDF